MNIQQLRQTLKVQWLNYYREHRDWLTRIGVWVTCEGKRRPSSSFMLATLSVLEPKLIQLLPLIVDLSSNPDRIVIALGLNFNPDEELEALDRGNQASTNGQGKMLPDRLPIDIPARRPVLEEPQPMEVEPVSKAQPAHLRQPMPMAKQVQPAPRTTAIDPVTVSPIAPAIDLVAPVAIEPIALAIDPVAPAIDPVAIDPVAPAIDPVAIDSPFGELTEPIMETAEADPPSPAVKLALQPRPDQPSPPFPGIPPRLDHPPVRPVIDTDELAAGELPRRE